MKVTGAVLLQRFEMCLCSVSNMRGKAVLGEFHVVGMHKAVAVCLRNDGSGGNGSRDRIALDDGPLAYAGPLQNEGVDEKEVCGRSEVRDRSMHREFCRFENVDAVYLIGVD